MRYMEDKGCYNHGPKTSQNTPNRNGAAATTQVSHKQRTTMGKSTPSKWDDAQKWLVGLSKVGEKSQSKKSKPRNSNADDLRLITNVPQKEHGYSSSEKEEENYDTTPSTSTSTIHSESETKNTIQVQSICFRDMGTEMTPIASQEPSRSATPIRATTPATRSPIHSETLTPMRGQNGLEDSSKGQHKGSLEGSSPYKKMMSEKKVEDHARKLSPLETRAIAWDEAERAKYIARFKREEVKIQAWENHQIRKAEMEMKKLEVKAERMKALAEERLTNKLAATKRIAEEKRANAEVKLNEKALRTTEIADCIRRTGHVPSSISFSFNFKLPSICW
ncbi:PREDICTED: uncharacterized protein At3g61260-like isoform X2 [Lupinus angustifolius]|uniref:uncharacterized protein At3g61260-like isoform X2 n=1 Tax=Lupinus angustifolius TaxID=3871 RepID=UPI00092F0755|nr:PREDICTED: uncharacterized protein At3g61260-like isoform X2 [Lupinus angustifolius]